MFIIFQVGQNPFSPEAVTEFLLFLKNTESSGITNLDLTVIDIKLFNLQ